MLPPGRARLATTPAPVGSDTWTNTIGSEAFQQYRLGLERITERIQELESKRRDLDETLAGLRALELEAKGRLDRALIEEAKRPRSKNTNGKRDLRSS